MSKDNQNEFDGLDLSKQGAMELWVGMPEFKQDKQEPYAKIIVRFAREDDLIEFSELIGQKLTPRTKSIWHPKLVRGLHSLKRYVEDES